MTSLSITTTFSSLVSAGVAWLLPHPPSNKTNTIKMIAATTAAIIRITFLLTKKAIHAKVKKPIRSSKVHQALTIATTTNAIAKMIPTLIEYRFQGKWYSSPFAASAFLRFITATISAIENTVMHTPVYPM